MKKRVGLICTLLMVLLMVLASCGGEVPVNGTTACTHEKMTVSMTELASCYEDGYEDKICELCGYEEHTVLKGGHDFEETYQAVADADLSICKLCGLRGYMIYAGDTLSLSGYFGGEISILAESLGAECEVELLIDGESAASATCKSGENSMLTAKDVEKKQHDITFANHGTEAVLIKEDNLSQLLNRNGSLLIEVLAGSADRYNSVNFYVQTSDPSGDYYVRYRMQYEYNDTRNSYGSNSTTNISNYRIKSAQLVKVNDVTDTAVLATDVLPVLTEGEISLAMKQKNVGATTLTEEAKKLVSGDLAADFVGGFHGDERLESVELLVDGDKIDTYGRTEGYVVPGTSAEFNQTATMYAWGTSTSDSYGDPMILHSQNFVFDSSGVENKQSAEWLGDGYEFDDFYFQMFTMVRETENGELVCEKVASFDENGNETGSVTIPMPVEKETNYLLNSENRGFRYSSESSGVFAEAGFEVINESIVPRLVYVAARAAAKDNKMYATFLSPTNEKAPAKGEIFEILVRYHIDCIAPEN